MSWRLSDDSRNVVIYLIYKDVLLTFIYNHASSYIDHQTSAYIFECDLVGHAGLKNHSPVYAVG